MSERVERASESILEFSQLPLVEVVARRLVEDRIPVTLPLAAKVAKRLEGDYHILEELLEFEALAGTPFVPISGIMGFKMENPATGLSLHIQLNQVRVQWSSRFNAPYPRIAAIRSAMETLVETVESILERKLVFPIVNLSYTNRIEVVEEAASFSPVLQPIGSKFFPNGFGKFGDLTNYQAQTTNVGDVDTNLHFRMVEESVSRQRFYLLTTGAGMWVRDLTVESAEHKVHSSLSTYFSDILSDRAKEVYGLII